MVVRAMSDAEVDRLFRALADATRRDILRRSIDGEVSVSTLASYYDALGNVAEQRAELESAVGVPLDLPASNPER